MTVIKNTGVDLFVMILFNLFVMILFNSKEPD